MTFAKIEKQLFPNKWILLRFELFERFVNKQDTKSFNDDLEKLQKQIEIVGIACFAEPDEASLKKYSEEFKSLKVVGNGSNFQAKYNIDKWPTSILIDPAGKVYKYYTSSAKLEL